MDLAGPWSWSPCRLSLHPHQPRVLPANAMTCGRGHHPVRRAGVRKSPWRRCARFEIQSRGGDERRAAVESLRLLLVSSRRSDVPAMLGDGDGGRGGDARAVRRTGTSARGAGGTETLPGRGRRGRSAGRRGRSGLCLDGAASRAGPRNRRRQYAGGRNRGWRRRRGRTTGRRRAGLAGGAAGRVEQRARQARQAALERQARRALAGAAERPGRRAAVERRARAGAVERRARPARRAAAAAACRASPTVAASRR